MWRPGQAAAPDAQEIGDEPALLARMLPEVPLVICADRFRGGQAAEERFQVDAHILDDGFQHLALARDVDLVALDATQTISDRHLLPAGRQREPLSALRRAQIVVLTRTDSADPQSLEELGAEGPSRRQGFSQPDGIVRMDGRSEWRGRCQRGNSHSEGRGILRNRQPAGVLCRSAPLGIQPCR